MWILMDGDLSACMLSGTYVNTDRRMNMASNFGESAALCVETHDLVMSL